MALIAIGRPQYVPGQLIANQAISMITLVDYPLLPAFVLSPVLIASAIEVGHWLGQRWKLMAAGTMLRPPKASILGLLALTIGFTFRNGANAVQLTTRCHSQRG